METITDYKKYRGKCKELCTLLVSQNPDLVIMRGYYYDAFWGKQCHWWCKDLDNNIIDPSKKQFPDQNGEYEEFDGICECANCGKNFLENDNGATAQGNYIFCSGQCYMNFVL